MTEKQMEQHRERLQEKYARLRELGMEQDDIDELDSIDDDWWSGKKEVELMDGLIRLSLSRDDDTEDPLSYDDAIFLVSYTRNYGSNHGYTDREDLFEEAKQKGWMLFPVYAYIHSGITFSVDSSLDADWYGGSNPYECKWDSGIYGYLVVDNAQLGWKTENISEHVENIIDEYDTWAQGECFVIGDSVCESKADGTIGEPDMDYCGGYIGVEWAKEELIDRVLWHLSEHPQKFVKTLSLFEEN